MTDYPFLWYVFVEYDEGRIAPLGAVIANSYKDVVYLIGESMHRDGWTYMGHKFTHQDPDSYKFNLMFRTNDPMFRVLIVEQGEEYWGS